MSKDRFPERILHGDTNIEYIRADITTKHIRAVYEKYKSASYVTGSGDYIDASDLVEILLRAIQADLGEE